MPHCVAPRRTILRSEDLPALFRTECVERLNALADLATTRLLSNAEAFLHGQLCSMLVQAVRAEMLGQKGKRYYVVSEDDLQRLLAGDAHRG